ncbi:DNA-binding protein [Nostocaceae cyanobacterium CENA369]|uniref:DNA-binding protein n=1 Tax=Dendronalium phyllosphericum CENA369 TaxID=1725256 RepID=A0A8J7IEM7_9NOST|nr:DNA-binding protein [Dendronalium phyllosphericum]MBH8578043.1 DNA-binding protein [Dendronalium phyllosphericum CENA369]
MSSKGIATREKVFAAADELFAKGILVTQEKIRKEIGGGSHSTIGKYIREWKAQEDDDIPVKSYPMPDKIKKMYEEMNEAHWNTFCSKYELITDDEKIAELEQENETLREKLEIARQDSIRLEQLEKIRKEENERYEKLVRQQREDAVEIQHLKNHIDSLISP